ncbi:hypothetical protein chiPu_0019874 [Chiloscyllium punctatum]|uniref:Tyrosine-protein kinase n=1 Tax=Chiloscyllium punctatum TaxID=137246 RepID=A0A401RTD8_CHIPU|nr:hypothetical protein [Chiloscyllium punctatum]
MTALEDTSREGSQSEGVGLKVYLYHSTAHPSESTLKFYSGGYTAEELCISAAKASGIQPVYSSLFALATEDLQVWYPPSHIFQVDGSNPQVVLYRIRFFFPNWFGQGSNKSYRYGLTKEHINTVLDYSVIDYLFAQSRTDFVSGLIKVPLDLQMQEECLGMAVLDIMRISKEKKWNLQQICDHVSYKSCIPATLRQQIQQHNFLTRKRIRRKFYKFLDKISHCEADLKYLKLKYLMDMESLETVPSKETFHVKDPTWDPQRQQVHKFICVSGEHGIQWGLEQDEWQPFCDFPEIVDITLKQASRDYILEESRIVTVTKQDNELLEAEFPTLREALSFVALIDGYYRLTADPHHYFCKEVAPPKLLELIEDNCHGPITSDFAIYKLKKLGNKTGLYLLRCSPKEFNKYFLTVCVETEFGKGYKDCLIIKEKSYSLAGVQRQFESLRELLNYYHKTGLMSEGISIQLTTCCPPRPKEKSNLVIVCSSHTSNLLTSPTMHRRNVHQMMFHKVKKEELIWGESLGQGSFTKIFKGIRKGNAHGYFNQMDVLLKVLDHTHRNYSESFFEAASIMSQISHKHLILVYGICAVSNDNIMVQEYMKYGALDMYLKKNRNKSCVNISWKLEVAKQLSYAMNFLEDRHIVHSNVSAKNVLLTREGDAVEGIPPFIKLSDPGVSITILPIEDYERLCDLSPTDLPSTDGFWRFVDTRKQDDPSFFEERHLKFISVLGKGNFGSVELCRYDPYGDNTGDLVAVKKLQQSTTKHLHDFEREIAVVKNLRNKYIVKYKGVCYSVGRRNLRLIMEYLPFGSLRDYLQKNKSRLDHKKLLLYASQICKGMDYLGSKRYVHRDLATRNILVESDTCVKIGDFGMTKVLPGDKDYYKVLEPGESPIFWYAIESLMDSKFSRESDVWSFGVVLYELFTYSDRSKSPPMVGINVEEEALRQGRLGWILKLLEVAPDFLCVKSILDQTSKY